MRCSVCGRSPATTLRTAGGSPYGPACADGTCQCLAWEGHFLRVSGGSQDDARLWRWQVRQHSARIRGVPFYEPAPWSPAEKRLAVALVESGLSGEALQMEVE